MSDTCLINPEAAPGHNIPDYAAEESARLARDFAELERSVTDLLNDARALPPTVEDTETASLYTQTIARFRDVDERIEGIREMEKLPFLRRGTAVDSFFFRMREQLFRRKRTDKAGGADVLQERLHAYNQKREAEERQKREAAERAAIEEEEKLRREAEALERQKREAEEKAARARKLENKEAAAQAAREADEAAAKLRAEQDAARERRQEAEADARAKPADLVRERHESGAMNTMRQVPYVEIVDAMKLDAVALWPFVKEDAKLAALKAWAKTTQHKRQMDGAVIEMRNETVVRR